VSRQGPMEGTADLKGLLAFEGGAVRMPTAE